MNQPFELLFQQTHYQTMLQYAANNLSEEVCGIVAGQQPFVQRILPVENQYHSLDVFQMQPQQQIEAFNQMEEANLELLAIYHSHPNGPEHPSQTDLDEFCYPGLEYIIWSRKENGAWQMKVFSIAENQYTEIPWHIL